MSSVNGPSPVALSTHRHGEIVSTSEYEDWFDTDGRLVKEAAMRETLFHMGVASKHRHILWKFLFGIYPMNSTRRDQRTIDLENRANYMALRHRWEILDKTIEIPDLEVAINNVPSYMEISADDIQDPFNNTSRMTQNNTKSEGNHSTSHGLGREVSQTAEAGSDKSPETQVCKCCHKLIDSLSDSTTTNSESGFSEGSCTLEGSEFKSDSAKSSPNHSRRHPNSSTDYHGDTIPGEHREQCLICLRRAAGERQCSCEFRKSFDENLDPDGALLLQILDFPSKIYAARQAVDLEKGYPKSKRIILRDVSRTDRNYHFFSHKRNLRRVHRILLIFSMFHPDIGYAQGMNDILARFLVVSNSEVDSYWLFTKYMESKRDDFMEHNMMAKVSLVKKLIKSIDRELYSFFESSECHDFLFCHRWLLLDFKREFHFAESIRIFEVLSTHHLELNSDKALIETDKAIAREFELDCGEVRPERAEVNFEFTFDVFVCVAILTMNSHDICKASDAAGIYGCLNGLSMNMDVQGVLTQAEELFYKYCRLSVTRGFSDIEV